MLCHDLQVLDGDASADLRASYDQALRRYRSDVELPRHAACGCQPAVNTELRRSGCVARTLPHAVPVVVLDLGLEAFADGSHEPPGYDH